MRERFLGDDGRRRLIDALSRQEAIADEALAVEVATCAVIEEFAPGSILIQQDATDNDVFFILAGAVSIQVNGREVARRRAGQHVGEMALIDPAAPRSASVVALEATAVAKVGEPDVDRLGQRVGRLWRNLARQLCVRLRERNALVSPRKQRPALFLGSSAEALVIAREIQAGLRYDAVDVAVWTDEVFGPSHFAIEDLESQLAIADFAALVLSPDDKVDSRGNVMDAPRDNVVFELGFFMGALGHRRSFIIKPRGVPLKIPSDLLGLTSIEYDNSAGTLAVALAPVCNDLRKIMSSLGAR